LITALQQAGGKRFTTLATQLADKLNTAPVRGTPTDLVATAMAFRSLKNDAVASKRLAEANELYFDPAAGVYLGIPGKIPMGIAVRAPASGDTPSAEVLALLAGVDEKTADLIRRNLLAAIEYDDLPPGDVLLGLSRK
jgi:hypothetical protein